MDKDLRTMLIKPDAPAPRTIGVRTWPRAIPQFNVGHLDVLEVRIPSSFLVTPASARAEGLHICPRRVPCTCVSHIPP